MKKILLFSALGICSISFGQTVLYSNDFEGTPGFNLNTTDLGGVTTAVNPWVINSLYAGGSGSFFCAALGFNVPFSVPAAPSQPAGITNNPNSQHLHVTPQIAIDAGGNLPVASYVAADGLCIFGNQSTFAAMNSDINTMAYDSVELDLWWTCGGSTTYYGEVYYSTDGGSSWSSLNCPATSTNQWRNETVWVNDQVTHANLAGQSTLRFGFRFITAATSTGSEADPGFAIDDIEVIGHTVCTPSAATITETACFDYVSPSGNYTWTSTGMYMDTIPNTAGCDSVITVDLTINMPDVGVTPSGMTLVADQAGATYQWLDCDESYAPVSGATGQTFSPTNNGNFAVMVTQNGCTDTSACSTVAGIGFDELTHNVRIYPNPTSGEIFIQRFDNVQDVKIVVRNIEGKLLFEKQFGSVELIRFQLEGESGVYFIEMISSEQQFNYKVVRN